MKCIKIGSITIYSLLFILAAFFASCDKDQAALEDLDSTSLEKGKLSLADLEVGKSYKISDIKADEFALLGFENPYARAVTHKVYAWHHFAGNSSATMNLNINGYNIDITNSGPMVTDNPHTFSHDPNISPGYLNRTWTFTYTTSATDWYGTGYLNTYSVSGGTLTVERQDYVNMSNWQPGPKSITNTI